MENKKWNKKKERSLDCQNYYKQETSVGNESDPIQAIFIKNLVGSTKSLEPRAPRDTSIGKRVELSDNNPHHLPGRISELF